MIKLLPILILILAPMSKNSAGEALDTQSLALTWTRVNDDDSAVSYSSDCTAQNNPDYYGKDMHVTSKVGGWCKFSFSGTGVKWIGGRNNNHGKVDIFIDGKLNATLDTKTPNWQLQQEDYVKTGLENGPHTLMIQLKTPGYQDFDAFEYLAQPPLPPKPVNLGHVLLPGQVPYLNTKQRYALGSGVVIAVGEPSGDWKQLTGPGYTSPNLIQKEELKMEIDGLEQPLKLEMKRAEKTGVYYGYEKLGDIQLHLIDFTCQGAPWISRLILIDNLSVSMAHNVRVRACIIPQAGLKHSLAEDGEHHSRGAVIGADTTVDIPSCGRNIKDKSAVISFSEPDATVFFDTESHAFTIESGMLHLTPGGSNRLTLCHYLRDDADESDANCLAQIRSRQSLAELEISVTDWQAWFENVPPAFQLGRIKEQRARWLMEGGLSVLKTNESLDGGLIAHATFYKEGYIRDAALGLRGLSSAGHFDELKRWLIWADHVREKFNEFPDAAGCEPSLDEQRNLYEFGNSSSECPAYFILTARDYYAGTKDLATLKSLQKSMQFAMEVQLKEAAANSYKMEFNGDETEICGVIDVTPSGTKPFDGAQRNDWAMPSLAMCAASLNFYIDYLKLCGADPNHYADVQTGTTINLPTELTQLLGAMDADFWRTDVPDLPKGFHDCFRIKSDQSWPRKRIVNFTLMPAFFGTPYAIDRKAKDIRAMAHYYDAKTGFLPLIPGTDKGFEGHDLGYLLWGLLDINDPQKDAVYQALVNGPTVDSWGAYNEAYTANGVRNEHDLRSLETGVNLSAIAKYWKLGSP